ncbi:MAG: preprotein translocase subunit SecG [Rickettsiales bacterium]|nr:preprotein translocase subunit SecG [Rickettsiales bacterium]
MEFVLLIIHVIIAIALIGIVLVQRSDTDGFGMGSGSGANLLSTRAKASFLTRGTAILATLFIVNSLVLSILAANRTDTSLIDRIEEANEPTLEMNVEDVKAPMGAPVEGGAEGEATPAAPVAPVEPQVPQAE